MTLLAMDLGSALRKVFTIYGAFWIVLLLVLYFGIGALLRKADRTRKH
jgi:hypothetical protein